MHNPTVHYLTRLVIAVMALALLGAAPVAAALGALAGGDTPSAFVSGAALGGLLALAAAAYLALVVDGELRYPRASVLVLPLPPADGSDPDRGYARRTLTAMNTNLATLARTIRTLDPGQVFRLRTARDTIQIRLARARAWRTAIWSNRYTHEHTSPGYQAIAAAAGVAPAAADAALAVLVGDLIDAADYDRLTTAWQEAGHVVPPQAVYDPDPDLSRRMRAAQRLDRVVTP